MKRHTLSYFLCFAILATSGCSIIFKSNSGKSNSADSSSLNTPLLEQKEAGTEVTWEVPSEPVDGFVIRYGDDRANLSKEVTILRSELREERDAQYGPVYRYIRRNIPDSSPVYVSVAAFKGDTISSFSDAVAETR
jgi:hypothetical protein